MSFHTHTSQRWSERWYIAFIMLPLILWAVLVFISSTVFWCGIPATLLFYLFARKRFQQSGNRVRSKEKAILASGIVLVGTIALTRWDYINNGIIPSVDDKLFVIEMIGLTGTYALVLLSMFLPEGIREAVENSVDVGGRVSTFITGD